jgi:hypothetical protein
MCNEHEHHISYHTDDEALCFRHAVLATINGKHVDTYISTYEMNGKLENGCNICDIEREELSNV